MRTPDSAVADHVWAEPGRAWSGEDTQARSLKVVVATWQSSSLALKLQPRAATRAGASEANTHCLRTGRPGLVQGISIAESGLKSLTPFTARGCLFSGSPVDGLGLLIFLTGKLSRVSDANGAVSFHNPN